MFATLIQFNSIHSCNSLCIVKHLSSFLQISAGKKNLRNQLVILIKIQIDAHFMASSAFLLLFASSKYKCLECSLFKWHMILPINVNGESSLFPLTHSLIVMYIEHVYGVCVCAYYMRITYNQIESSRFQFDYLCYYRNQWLTFGF